MRQSIHLPSLLAGLFSGLLMLAVAEPLAAQDATRQEFDDPVHVVQPKPVLQKGRFDLAPRVGLSINDSMYRHFKVGTNANFHLTERLYFGGVLEWYDFNETIGGRTEAYQETVNETRTSADAPVVNWMGGAEIGFKPILGKFALFSSYVIYYDFGVSLGGGVLDAESIETSSGSPTGGGTISANSRIFLNDWLAVNLELRDIIFMGDLRGESQSLSNVLTFGAGASFYLPTSFDYSEQ